MSDATTGAHRETFETYRQGLVALLRADVPFLVGGAFALRHYTGVARDSKDFDVFLREETLPEAASVLEKAGFEIQHFSPHWLSKACRDGRTIDLIFSSGNGVARVDDAWFEHAGEGELLGSRSPFVPAEEMLWSKAFIQERERFDGADIAHILRDLAGRLDWPRLLDRFGENWRVLLGHLVMFGFIYPGRRGTVPAWVMDELVGRLQEQVAEGSADTDVCRGTLLSRLQYLGDVEQHGYGDGRLPPTGAMRADHAAAWTERGLDELGGAGR